MLAKKLGNNTSLGFGYTKLTLTVGELVTSALNLRLVITPLHKCQIPT